MHYRKEIDGLRALAVLPVILFHAGFDVFSGGFVGVDVFFVISGYLITGILAQDLEKDRFSILRFYERRARRILPALFLILLVSGLLAVLILLPYELVSFGQGVLGVVGFYSNILFWSQSGYFADASELNPLLHTWSLAVEEQFYLIIPLIMLALWSLVRRRGVAVVFLCGFLGSFFLAHLLAYRMPSANFFLLPTRAWELLAGSLLALWVMRHPPKETPLCSAISALGLLAILGAIVSYSKATPIPSAWALLPVLGTAAVLYGANATNVVGRMLSARWMVGIGLISYSAYLWHQPLFAFARVVTPNAPPSTLHMLALSVLSLFLAWASWRWVETPFRNAKLVSRRWVFTGSAACAALFALIGTIFVMTSGLPQRYDTEQRPWLTIGPLEYARYVEGPYQEVVNRPLSKDQPNLLIVGDSFSQDLLNVIREGQFFDGYALSAVNIPARCQIHFGQEFATIKAHIEPEFHRMCKDKQFSQADIDTMQAADIVVFAARWKPWAAIHLSASLRAMGLSDHPGVFVVGPKEFERHRRNLLQIPPAQAAAFRKPPPDGVVSVNDILKSQISSETFVDILANVCPDGCPLFTPENALISYDGLHLTKEGAAFLADRLGKSFAPKD